MDILEPVPVYVVLSVFVTTGQYSRLFRDANCCVCAGYRFTVRLWSLFVGVSVLINTCTAQHQYRRQLPYIYIYMYLRIRVRTATKLVTLTGERNG